MMPAATSTIDPASATPSLQSSPPVSGRRWQVGTLAYSGGGLATVFFWLLWGDFTLTLKERAIPQVLQVLLKDLGASDFTLGLFMSSIPAALALVLSPIVGYRSDRHRGRWGRRIPFLLIPTPIALLATIGLAFSLRLAQWAGGALGAHSPGQDRLAIAFFGLFWILFEFSSIMCVNIFTCLINDVVPRELIGRFFGMFRIVGLSAVVLFNYYLFATATTHYVPVFLGIGVLYTACFLMMCLRVKEGEYPPPEPVHVSTARVGVKTIASVRTYLRDCFTHSYYWWYIASLVLFTAATIPINTFIWPYARSLNMSKQAFGTYMAIQPLVILIQAYPVGWLADKLHPLRLTIAALLVYSAATFAAFLLIGDARGLGIAIIACGACAGFYGNAVLPLGPALLPRMKFAQFMAAYLIINSLANLLFAPLFGLLLDGTGHNYRLMYLWASVVTALGLAASVVVHRRFMAYGGPRAYVAPA